MNILKPAQRKMSMVSPLSWKCLEIVIKEKALYFSPHWTSREAWILLPLTHGYSVDTMQWSYHTFLIYNSPTATFGGSVAIYFQSSSLDATLRAWSWLFFFSIFLLRFWLHHRNLVPSWWHLEVNEKTGGVVNWGSW